MSVRPLALLAALALALPSCSFDRAITNSSRTATEQLLLTESIRQAVEQTELPEVAGRSVTITTVSLAGDTELGFLKAALEERVRRDGGSIVAEGADMTLDALVSTSGTDDRRMTLGISEISSAAFAFPGLYIFDFHRQLGFTKLTIDATDADGRHIASTAPVLGSTYFNVYKWLLLFVFRSDNVFQDGYDWRIGMI